MPASPPPNHAATTRSTISNAPCTTWPAATGRSTPRGCASSSPTSSPRRTRSSPQPKPAQALATFERLGAAASANDAAALLRELGAPARTGRRTIDVLSEREQEVLALVAIGLPNPEIAQRLYISRKTAANHVSNILVKLGLRNRAELVAYAVAQPSGRSARAD